MQKYEKDAINKCRWCYKEFTHYFILSEPYCSDTCKAKDIASGRLHTPESEEWAKKNSSIKCLTCQKAAGCFASIGSKGCNFLLTKLEEEPKKEVILKPTQYLNSMGRILNRVKRMHKITVDILSDLAYRTVDKYAWMCKTCGRVWAMKDNAVYCQHQDFVLYGRTKFFCLSKEPTT